MKIILLTFIFTAIGFSQGDSIIDLGKLSETLRLAGTELKIENVTVREAATRGLPLKSAWIVSAPSHELFFPLVIYTAPKGVLNGEKYDDLRKFIRENPPKKGQFGHGLGFFDVPDTGECFVFMEEFRLSSNRPPTAQAVLSPWLPNRKSGLSIIGTLESEDLDFQIALLFPEEDELSAFPEYKSMLYGPDFPDIKKLSAELVKVTRDSNILPSVKTSPKNIAQIHTQKISNTNVANSINPFWLWFFGSAVLLLTMILFWIRRRYWFSGKRR